MEQYKSLEVGRLLKDRGSVVFDSLPINHFPGSGKGELHYEYGEVEEAVVALAADGWWTSGSALHQTNGIGGMLFYREAPAQSLPDMTDLALPLNASKVHFVTSEAGDWIGMYLNGLLLLQGHRIDGREAVATLVDTYGYELEVSSEERPQEWFDGFGGHCPKVLPE